MGRPIGSKNKKPRAKARTPYETYSAWYDQYTKNGRDKLFSPKYNQQDFEYWYRRAKAKGLKNPARKVAMEQEYVERSMEKALRKAYGDNFPDLSDKQSRIKFSEDWVNSKIAEGLSESKAWEEFREYFY